MTGLAVKMRTALALGPSNLVRVAWYRAGIRLGFNGARRVRGAAPTGRMFREPVRRAVPAYIAVPNTPSPGSEAPCWHRNAFSGVSFDCADGAWWTIPDFDPEVGDIKGVWLASRFDWIIALAQQVFAGRAGSFLTMESWLADWCAANPPGRGPNWKCGQEASIRVMHLATAAILLDQVSSSECALLDLVELHLRRIAPTMGYAIAQDNNHGTSEAAALFIGGSWLAANGRPEGRKWTGLGRRWLEDRVRKLVGPEGTFSQYSVNYHRLMLDTLSLVEVWRRTIDERPFSGEYMARAGAAAEWLRSLVIGSTGDAPNIGANDGALLIPLAGTEYRDFRPSVQLATQLFTKRRAKLGLGSWDSPLFWLGLPLDAPGAPPLKAAQTMDDGGFAVLRRGSATAFVRYPRFRFRPSHADALHVDFWLDGLNLLRDAGTYSYNTDDRWLRYFPGTEAHNTVQFDGRDQMPRIGRFLFGDWIRTSHLVPANDGEDGVRFEAGYRDRRGAIHNRAVRLHDGLLTIVDQVQGPFEKAVVRWRLAPGEWRLANGRVTDGVHTLKFTTTIPAKRLQIVEGWESRYYMERTAIPVVEIELDHPSEVTTTVSWTQ